MKPSFIHSLRFAVAFLFVVAACGAASAVFLRGLDAVTAMRLEHAVLYLFAPLVGLLTGVAYHHANRRHQGLVGRGNELIVTRLRGQSQNVPAVMAPLILISTWTSHLVGASVGREGTAVQMAGAIGSFVAKRMGLDQGKTWHLLLCAVAAGFGSVFGVPLAGAVFALEVAGLFRRERGRGFFSSETFLIPLSAFAASLLAHEVTLGLGVHHVTYPKFDFSVFSSPQAVAVALVAAVGAGLLAWGFIFVLAKLRMVFFRFIRIDAVRPLVGGVFISLGFFCSSFGRYSGLGADVITESYVKIQSFVDPLAKLLFTAFAIASGFRGGEVTPLFYIGATFASAMSGLITSDPSSLAGLGMVAVFGAASGTPIAMAVMAGELFGWLAFFPAVIFCLIASSVCRSGRLYDEI